MESNCRDAGDPTGMPNPCAKPVLSGLIRCRLLLWSM
jgi:hypothetical protein